MFSHLSIIYILIIKEKEVINLSGDQEDMEKLEEGDMGEVEGEGKETV